VLSDGPGRQGGAIALVTAWLSSVGKGEACPTAAARRAGLELVEQILTGDPPRIDEGGMPDCW
jgi:hypothetical protein